MIIKIINILYLIANNYKYIRKNIIKKMLIKKIMILKKVFLYYKFKK